MPSTPAPTARVLSSEWCRCLPLGTRWTMEAPERDAGCVLMDLSFHSITLAPHGNRAQEARWRRTLQTRVSNLIVLWGWQSLKRKWRRRERGARE